MRKILAAVLAGLISTALGWCADSSEKQKTVAVCEFEVTASKDVDAEWIGQGVPDLLQIELQDHGISLLDRDFVVSVLREQRREASGVMDGRNRVGGLLGANILVEGAAKLEGKFGTQSRRSRNQTWVTHLLGAHTLERERENVCLRGECV